MLLLFWLTTLAVFLWFYNRRPAANQAVSYRLALTGFAGLVMGGLAPHPAVADVIVWSGLVMLLTTPVPHHKFRSLRLRQINKDESPDLDSMVPDANH